MNKENTMLCPLFVCAFALEIFAETFTLVGARGSVVG
jgi:hypothetical protein